MKSHKSIKYIISCILLVCGMLAGNAQEHGFRWGKWSEGHHYSGGGGLVDKVVDSYIDSAGNTYIWGQCGLDARLGEDGPYICPMDSIPGYWRGNAPGVFLAKIDTAGNIVWHKATRCGTNNSGSMPWNMVVKDNKITVAFDNDFSGQMYDWFFFFDTMLIPPVTTVARPYPYIAATYFVTFDFDGNRLDVHQVRMNWSREIPINERWGYNGRCFAIDKDDNIHTFTTSDPGVGKDFWPQSCIIVDNDTNKIYTLGLKHEDGKFFTTSMYCKFDSTWNLVNKRIMIDSIAIINHPIMGYEHLYLQFSDLKVDGDELFINGLFRGNTSYESVTDTVPFVANIFIDSVHYLRATNATDFSLMPFLIKLNTDGVVQWTQQLYTGTQNRFNFGPLCGGLALDKNNVYTNCSACYDYTALDSAHTIPISHPQVEFNLTTSYNRVTGAPVDFYLLDSTDISTEGDFLLINDEIIMHADFDLLRKTEVCKINKHTKAVTKIFPIHYADRIHVYNISATGNGWIFRGETGDEPRVYDSIFLGNYQWASVMTFFYDSTLDSRIKPCPQADSLWGDSIANQTATLFWRSRYGQAGYELAYMPEGGSWDNATILETDSTTATIALPDDRCYQFRLRALCGGRREAYSPWCDPITLCPEHRTDVGIAPADSPRLALYPNPASGLVQILGLSGEAPDVEILDMTGRTAASFRHTTSIDISNLAQGSYLAQIHTAQGILTLKLVKD